MERVISYYEHESQMARMERTNTRLWLLCILLVIFLVATNGLWLYYNSQWETISVEQEASSEGGGNAFINSGGDFNYGTSETDSNVQAP